ncbi:unnamed protein product, partial [Polarella glacialis]
QIESAGLRGQLWGSSCGGILGPSPAAFGFNLAASRADRISSPKASGSEVYTVTGQSLCKVRVCCRAVFSQEMDQALQALQALYSSPDPATKKEADDWLTKFQQTPAAWQVVDSLLSSGDAPMQFRFFAAQTMRTKVQFDFYELPAESYGSLRDSLLGHIDRGNTLRNYGTESSAGFDQAVALRRKWRQSNPADVELQQHTLAATAALATVAPDRRRLCQRTQGSRQHYPGQLRHFQQRSPAQGDENAPGGAPWEMTVRIGESLYCIDFLASADQVFGENNNLKLMTDSFKREHCKERLQSATSQVVQFLLNLQCPSIQAKRKVLECFLSWIKFTNLQANDIAQNPFLPECFKYVVEGGDLSETATDIIIEVLRMCSLDLSFFQPVIQVILQHITGLRSKFDALLGGGAQAALDADQDGLLQICRIYVETGECLVPLIMAQSNDAQVVGILQVILRCTDLPSQEISSIPLEFWHRLAHEVCRHPETDAKIDQFQGVYVELLSIMLRRCTLSMNEDPFQADDEVTAYRQRFLGLAEAYGPWLIRFKNNHNKQDSLEILTPNTAMEHVLKSLQEGQSHGVAVQEAHFFALASVGARAEVRDGSVLWQLIQSLPPLISQPIQENSPEGAMLHFTKKTAIELLGHLWQWVKTRPDFLRSALEMISQLLLQSVPPGSPAAVLERVKQVQQAPRFKGFGSADYSLSVSDKSMFFDQAASIAFKDICFGGKHHLQDMQELAKVDVGVRSVGDCRKMHHKLMPIRMHLFIVDGIGAVVANLQQDDAFRNGLEQLVTPLVDGLSSERQNPNVLSEILDRLTTIIRQISVREGTTKAADVGRLISSTFWPLIRQTLAQHPSDGKVVEKSCRLLKHSMRCVPDLFKPNVPDVANTLVTAFQQYQHSSYLYSAEILANSYANDPEVVPVLTQLFHQLSSIGLQCLMSAGDRLQEITELVEDFYGMFERYLRYAPMIVLEAPTLPPTLQLWNVVIFVQQKDAVEAIIAFIEAVLGLVAEVSKANRRAGDERKAHYGQMLRPHVMQVAPGFVEALFRLIAGVPTRYVQECLPSILDGVRNAFPQEFPTWLENAFKQLPPNVASKAEQQKFGEQLVRGDDSQVYEAIQDPSLACHSCSA